MQEGEAIHNGCCGSRNEVRVERYVKLYYPQMFFNVSIFNCDPLLRFRKNQHDLHERILPAIWGSPN